MKKINFNTDKTAFITWLEDLQQFDCITNLKLEDEEWIKFEVDHRITKIKVMIRINTYDHIYISLEAKIFNDNIDFTNYWDNEKIERYELTYKDIFTQMMKKTKILITKLEKLND